MINKSNYEAYLIDYLDGNLAPHEEAALLLFLDEHPGIREEFEGLEDVQLNPASTVGFDASSLMKPPHEDRDTLLALLLEGDLKDPLKTEVEKKIASDSGWEKDWALMQATVVKPQASDVFDHSTLLFQTILSSHEASVLAAIDGPVQYGESSEVSSLRKIQLKPETSVVYPNKSGLRHTPVFAMRTRWIAAAAAVVLVLISLPFWNSREEVATASRIEVRTVGTRMAGTAIYPEVITLDQQQPSVQDASAIITPLYAFADNRPSPDQPTKQDFTEDRMTLMSSAALHPSLIPTGFRSPALAGQPKSLPTLAQLPEQRPNTDEFVTGREFFTHQIKKNLWGEEDYPQDGYALALAEKGANKISDKLAVQVDPTASKQEKRGFRFKLGAFEISR